MITAWKIQQGPWVTSQSEERKTLKLNYETRFLKNCKLSKTDVYEKEDFHFVNRMRQWNARYPKRLDFLILHIWKYVHTSLTSEQKKIIKFVFKSLAQAARYKNSNHIFIKVQGCMYLNSNVQSKIQLLHGI